MQRRERKFITLPTDVLERAKRDADHKGMNFSGYISMCVTEYWKYQDRQEKLAEKIGEQMAERKDMDTKALQMLEMMMKQMEQLEKEAK